MSAVRIVNKRNARTAFAALAFLNWALSVWVSGCIGRLNARVDREQTCHAMPMIEMIDYFYHGSFVRRSAVEKHPIAMSA